MPGRPKRRRYHMSFAIRQSIELQAKPHNTHRTYIVRTSASRTISIRQLSQSKTETPNSAPLNYSILHYPAIDIPGQCSATRYMYAPETRGLSLPNDNAPHEFAVHPGLVNDYHNALKFCRNSYFQRTYVNTSKQLRSLASATTIFLEGPS